MNLSTIKIGCSYIGSLMATQRDNKPLTEKNQLELIRLMKKEDAITERQKVILKTLTEKWTNYNPAILPNSVKSKLIEIYSDYVYSKGSINIAGQEAGSMAKGNAVEAESIKLLSDLDGKNYTKNQKLYSNRYIKGFPDVITTGKNKIVIEIKTSWDINTFLGNIDTSTDYNHYCQMQGYLELLKCDYGQLCYCLVNTPINIIEQEIKKTKHKYFLHGKSDAELNERIEYMYHSMIFDDIPKERRVIRVDIVKDQEMMPMVYEKVKSARIWMKEFHRKHFAI